MGLETLDLSDATVSSAVASFLSLSPTNTAALSPSVSAALASVVAAQSDAAAEAGLDPLLAALPNFVYAMPVQLVILGITLCLLGMLLVHLLFTIRYHLPLSNLNYALQTSATMLSLANISIQLRLVMVNLYQNGRRWPFMFDYIEITLPDDDWSKAKRGGWLCMQGLNALIVHSTHIQFLTMLFPSTLEVNLILGLLGPLALSTFALSFTTLSTKPAVNDLGDAIWNTANSSLTLLYTMALFIWGLTINRSRAWRSEGGTAIFGVMALMLGVLGTAVNFVEIKEDRMKWLPGVVTCILLWQSWVGFWWWVGAGMWAGEAEDVQKRREKKERKVAAKKRRKELKEKAEAELLRAQGSARSVSGTAGGTIRRRFGRSATIDERPTTANSAGGGGEAIELRDLSSNGPDGEPTAASTSRPQRPANSRRGTDSDSTLSSSRPTSHHFYDPVLNLFIPFLTRLRTAHDAAAVAQAAKPPGLPEEVRRGWGIRALMMRGRKERGERRQAAAGVVREGGELAAAERRAGFELEGGQRLEGSGDGEEDGDGEWEDEVSSQGSSASGERDGAGETSYPPRPARGDRRNTNEDGDDTSWWWRGWIGRARLRDVSTW
ncbi:uncharacterized protein JCM6883_004100 [Sporobolomyces salmoneus]|uniref:uncharacterized protein n=1 Tax=Sporobolomyces salmoneus TaxID=183962 RepID=UPI0031798876